MSSFDDEDLFAPGRLPTQVELRELPRWALVAYAGHFARRVLPLIDEVLPDLEPALRSVLVDAVRATERTSEGRDNVALLDGLADVQDEINRRRIEAFADGPPPEPSMVRAQYLHGSVDGALRAAHAAANGDDGGILSPAQAAIEGAVLLRPELLGTARGDYERMLARARHVGWDEFSTGALRFLRSRLTVAPGRLLTVDDLRGATGWPAIDEGACLLDGWPEEHLPEHLLFVSHPWLSSAEPDPQGLKLAELQALLARLDRFAEQIAHLGPRDIDRDRQRRLTHERFRIPLALARDVNEAGDHLFGWHWSADGDEAPTKFLAWLRRSVEDALGARLWIDSHAWPHPAHRRRCEYCASMVRAAMYELPELVQRSTCLVLSDVVPDQEERGWMALEGVAAASKERLINLGETPWDVEELKARLFHGDYRCTEFADGSTIQIAWALAEARRILELEDQHHASYSDPVDPEPLLAMLEWPLGVGLELDDGRETVPFLLVNLLRTLGTDRFRQACLVHARGFDQRAASLLLWIGTAAATAILVAGGWRARTAIPRNDWHPVLAVQAMLLVSVCRRRRSPFKTMALLIAFWGVLYELDTIELFAVAPPEDVNMVMLDDIRRTHDLWRDGGTVVLGMADFDSLDDPDTYHEAMFNRR